MGRSARCAWPTAGAKPANVSLLARGDRILGGMGNVSLLTRGDRSFGEVSPAKALPACPERPATRLLKARPAGAASRLRAATGAEAGADGSPRRRASFPGPGVQSAHGQKFDGCPPLTRIARVVWRARQRNAIRPMAARQAHPRSIGRRLVRQARQVLFAPRWRHEGGINVPTTRRTTQ